MSGLIIAIKKMKIISSVYDAYIYCVYNESKINNPRH